MKLNRILFFAVMASLALLLSACGAAPATNWPGMTTDGTNIYLADGSYVYVVQAGNGTEVTTTIDGAPAPLRFPAKADSTKSFYTVPALTTDGHLVVGSAASGNHALFGLTTSNMQQGWSYNDAKKPIGQPWVGRMLAMEDTVYAPSGDGNLYKFTSTGDLLWKVKLSEHSLWSAPVSDGESLYITTQDHIVFSLSPQSGATLWQKELDNGITSSPALADGMLYVGTLSGNLYALKATDGSQVWMTKLEGGIWGTPAVQGELVFTGTATNDKTGKFYALSTANGQVSWMQTETGAIVAGPLAASDKVIIVTETGDTKAYNFDGVQQWIQHIENAKIYSTPLLVNDLVVIAPMNVRDYLLTAYTIDGVQKWQFIPSK